MDDISGSPTVVGSVKGSTVECCSGEKLDNGVFGGRSVEEVDVPRDVTSAVGCSVEDCP